MSGIKQALFFGSLPIIVAFLYFVFERTFGTALTADPGGGTLLLGLGLAMGFSVFVIVRGARDI